jgi:RND family efflux transporter MFP subunit
MKNSVRKAVRTGATSLVTVAIVVASILWLSNFFGTKIPASGPAGEGAEPSGTAPAPGSWPLYTVTLEEVPQLRTAVGTVQAVHTADVGSKLMAQVKSVHVRAGQEVNEGDVLVELDDQDIRAQVQQAQAQVEQAKATAEQAERDFQKQAGLFKSGATSEQEYLRYKTDSEKARAAVMQAEQALRYAQTTLSWAVIRSPITGVVVDKLVEAGDLVRPGQTLVRVYNRDKMQLVASVPESLTSRLSPGQDVDVKIDVLPKACVGTVSEIVPEAATQSRTFQVKVTGPCPPGVYSGMFGRLLIPVGQEKQMRIPVAAVRTFGQLQQVLVSDGKAARRRFVSLGETAGDRVVVLSGLAPGEKIVANYGESSFGPGSQPAGLL